MSYWHRDRQDPSLRPEPWWSFQKPIAFAMILVMALVCLWAGWYFLFSTALEDNQEGNILVLRSPPGPFSIRPDDYGRPVVPHQDKVLYNQFGQIQEDLASTTLRQAEESAVMFGGFESEKEDEDEVSEGEIGQVSLDGESEFSEENAEDRPSLDDELSSDDPSGNLVLFSSEETCPVVVAQGEGKEPIRKGRFWLQLSSMKTWDLAQQEWDRLKREHKTVLRKYQPVLVRVNLGAAIGEQYQIHIGYFPVHEDAKKLCEKFQSAGIGCLVSGE